MGANHSNGADDFVPGGHTSARQAHLGEIHGKQTIHGHKKHKAKPLPPGKPQAKDVSSNSVTLTWAAPRHTGHMTILAYTVEVSAVGGGAGEGRRWRVMTKSCQGTTYQARHLETGSAYAFRVRAENVYGVGKHSMSSDVVFTNLLDCSQAPSDYSPVVPEISSYTNASDELDTTLDACDGFVTSSTSNECLTNVPEGENTLTTDSSGISSTTPSADTASTPRPLSPDIPSTSSPMSPCATVPKTPRRRHSFNMHLESGVTKMLNNTDISARPKSTTASASTSATLSVSSPSFPADQPHVRHHSATIHRNHAYRGSLQSGRKISLPIMLPGTGTNSLNRLRESRNSLRTSTSDILITSPKAQPAHSRNGTNRHSLESRSSDINTSTPSSDDGGSKPMSGSRSSLQSSLSDMTVSNSRDGCSFDGSKNSLFDVNSFSTSAENGFGTGSFEKSIDRENNERNNQLHTDSVNKVLPENEPLNSNNNNNNNTDDEVMKLKEELKQLEITEEKLKLHDLKEKFQSSRIGPQKDYYLTLDNPWEIDTSVDGMSERIMAAPFCDDMKMALHARNMPEDPRSPRQGGTTADCARSVCPNPGVWDCESDDINGGTNFRTLRSVLQSSNMLVKTSRSLPDVVGVVMGEGGEARTLTRGPSRLTTIADDEEEEDPVRVTTL